MCPPLMEMQYKGSHLQDDPLLLRCCQISYDAVGVPVGDEVICRKKKYSQHSAALFAPVSLISSTA